MVSIINKAGIEMEVSLEIAKKFIKSGDITGYKTLEWEFVEGEIEPVIEEPVKRKNVVRKIKTNKE